jgi:LmbE family N-acetylglucosaminyl deacetylase
MSKVVAVIVAHPDDEILGCGGTIASHVTQGDQVHVFILAEGLTSREKVRDLKKMDQALNELRNTAQMANDLLGVSTLHMNQFPDNRMDSIDRLDIIKSVEDFINQYKPSIVYTHHAGDLNIDHRLIHEAVVTACRPMPNAQIETLLFFEVASSTEWQTPGSSFFFTPNWYVDITKTLILKLKALEIYQSEMRPWPHARSLSALEYLAKWRGANIGVSAAEAFMLGRRCVLC